jgi:hypothetical protein
MEPPRQIIRQNNAVLSLGFLPRAAKRNQSGRYVKSESWRFQMTTKTIQPNTKDQLATAFKGNMTMLAAFIASEIEKKTAAKLQWKFHPTDGDFRRRKDWNAYGFLTFQLADNRNGTIVAGMSDGPTPRYAFDGALNALTEEMELKDLPRIVSDLASDLMQQLGLSKRK